MHEKADLILKSRNIFTAVDDKILSGYIAIRKDRIIAVGEGEAPSDLTGDNTMIYELGDQSVFPGFIDVHCFFTGYVVRFIGADLKDCHNSAEVFAILDIEARDQDKDQPLFGHDLSFEIEKEELNARYPGRPVVLFKEGCESCCMNDKAISRFNFTPLRCYPEAYAAIFPYILGNKEFIIPEFRKYMKLLNSRGVTAVKEMGFDDFCDFPEILEELEKEEKLTLRVSFMSQPVLNKADFSYGEKMKEKYHSDTLTFSGFNQMTDGSVSEFNAQLKEPYNGLKSTCMQKIDWKQLQEDTLEADKRGFRFSLHAQGDGAIAKVLDIYEQCQRDHNGRLVNRHAITDLEFSDPEDLKRMGELGAIAEIYPQIQSIANRKDKVSMIKEKIGESRGRYYWNRRKMADSNITISCGTDLPLLIDDIPESIYHAVGAYFPEGGEPFNEENTLTRTELLKAWTAGGAYNLGKEKIIGTIEPGKKADIAIFDGDLFNTPLSEIRDLQVLMTVFNGRIVYKKAEKNKAYFMGIDTGTNSSKGVLIDDQGSIIAQYSTTHSMSNPAPGHYEHDAEKDWWGDLCLISNKLIELSHVDPQDIKAIGTSALGADCLPVDEQCRPLRKAILYGIDARAVDEMEELTEMYGEEQIRKWYGRPLCSSDVMPKILWIKNKEPEVYKKTFKFITASTYLTAKLCGRYVVDKFLGLASFNPLYGSDWKPVPELCKPICRPDQLAEIHEATDVVGHVTSQAAKETGLAEGTAVLTGTDDSGAEAISVGVVSPGKMMIQIGSSIYMILGTSKLIDDERLWREEFIVPGLCDISAGTNTAGSLTKWYRDTLFPDALVIEAVDHIDAYETMMKGVAEIPAGSDGLITLPYWAGERTPINDPQAKGILFGLTLAHTRAHLYRSALEAVAYSINQQLKLMKAHDIPLDQIFVTGGGTLNETWMQIIADVIGMEISVPAVNIGASFGDALMAASAIRYPGFETYDSLLKFIRPGKTYKPDRSRHEVYQQYQALYDELYEATKKLMHRIDDIVVGQ